MSNAGVNTNSSTFYVTNAAAPHLDGRYVVFGRLVEGQGALVTILTQFTAQNAPLEDIEVVACGVE